VGDRKGVKRKSRQKKGFFLLYKHKTAPFSQKREFSFFFSSDKNHPITTAFPFQQRQARTKIKRKEKRKQSKNVLERLQKKMSITNGRNRTTISQGRKRG